MATKSDSGEKLIAANRKPFHDYFVLQKVEAGIALNGFGAWTLKQELREAGAEPDECYIVGDKDRDIPDLVIEVEWSRTTGLPKREIYRRLGVKELWTLKGDGSLIIAVLHRGAWVGRSRSKLLPRLDPARLCSFLLVQPQSKAVRSYLDALRGRARR